MMAVGDESAAHGLRVIGVARRSTVRSASRALSVAVLAHDFKELRRVLQLDRWRSRLGIRLVGVRRCITSPDPTAFKRHLRCLSGAPTRDGQTLPVVADLVDQAGKHDAEAVGRNASQSPQRLRLSIERL
jgi:hypothetical protein